MTTSIPIDQALTLAEAARCLPMRNNGRPIHVAALYRWASRGCRGVRLETIQLGGQMFTSMQALQHFADALTERLRQRREAAQPHGPRHIGQDIKKMMDALDAKLGIEKPQDDGDADACGVV